MTGLHLVTGPTVEPITLAVAKSHLRLEGGDDDVYVTTLISVVREAVERWTRRAMYEQTWRMTLPCFPYGASGTDLPVTLTTFAGGAIDVHVPPLRSVTSIAYVDENGASQTLAGSAYRVTIADVGIITPAFGTYWPSTQAVEGAVLVTFVAGYVATAAGAGDPGSLIPASIKHAMLLWLGQLYEQREAVITGTIAAELPMGVADLLAPHRSVRF